MYLAVSKKAESPHDFDAWHCPQKNSPMSYIFLNVYDNGGFFNYNIIEKIPDKDLFNLFSALVSGYNPCAYFV
jgi:hypothetical protein